jgi:integrase
VGTDNQTTPIPIERFREEVLARLKAESASDPRYATHSKAFRLLESAGAARTVDLTPVVIDRFMASLQGASTTKDKYLNLAKSICREAVEKSYLDHSPFDVRPDQWKRSGVYDPRATNRRLLTTPVQLAAVLDYLKSKATADLIDHRFYALAMIMTYTGMYAIDALMLKVNDIDFVQGMILAGQNHGKPTKHRRPLPMSSELAKALTDWIQDRGIPHNRRAKLDFAKADEIRRLKSEGVDNKELARRFGVKPHTIEVLLRGKLWRPGTLDRVAQSIWLFPDFRDRQNDAPSRNGLKIKFDRQLKAAALACNLDRLRLDDFLFNHRHNVVPCVRVLKPRS